MKSDEASVPLQFHNGSLLPANEGVLSVSEIGRLTGIGIFETIPIHYGSPFALSHHIERLQKGADRFGLPCLSLEALREKIEILLRENGFSEAPLAKARVTIISADQSGSGIHEIVEIGPPPSHTSTAEVITLPFARNEKSALAGIKTINYSENAVAQREAKQAGADDALFANTSGDLCEGIWANAFFKVSGRWITPDLSSGCLPGITRMHVLGLSEDISEENLSSSRLGEVSSAFFTSSMRGIQPIASINGRSLESPSDPDIDRWVSAFQQLTAPVPPPPGEPIL